MHWPMVIKVIVILKDNCSQKTIVLQSHGKLKPTIACNSMIASNKQRQEHVNNLATIWRAKLKEAYEHSKSL